MRAWDCIELQRDDRGWLREQLREEKALLAKPGVAIGLQIGDDLRGRKVGRSQLTMCVQVLEELDNRNGFRGRGSHGVLHRRGDDSGLVGPDRRIPSSSPRGPHVQLGSKHHPRQA